jgi:ribonuclease III
MLQNNKTYPEQNVNYSKQKNYSHAKHENNFTHTYSHSMNSANNETLNIQDTQNTQNTQNMQNMQNIQNIQNEDFIHLTPEEMRSRILNEKNIPITEDFVNGIFKRLGFNHKVKNIKNFQEAMIHSSYLEENIDDPKTMKILKEVPPIDPKARKNCMPLQTESYERLEYLGDGIIRHAIGKYLFTRYQKEKEGFLTTNRSKMENKDALSDLAKKLGIQNYAVISRQMEMGNSRSSYVTLTEDLFEAFVGALLCETDDNNAVEFIRLIIEKELDVPETIRTQNNYKDQLMQYFHKFDVVKHDLQYDDFDIETDNGKKRYKTIVIDKDTRKKLGTGSGGSKKKSQQRAAKDALIKLGKLGNDDVEDEYFDIADVGDINDEINKVRSCTNIVISTNTSTNTNISPDASTDTSTDTSTDISADTQVTNKNKTRKNRGKEVKKKR